MLRFVLGISLLIVVSDAAVGAEVSVTESRFVVRLVNGDGSSLAKETNKVPLVPNRICYGWEMRLDTQERLVRFREEFTLPSGVPVWGGTEGPTSTAVVAPDGKSAVTERFAAPKDGWIGNSWCVQKGDPLGDHEMKVFVNGKLMKVFTFEVVEAK